MQSYQIKVGDHLRENRTLKFPDDIIEKYMQYYLILDVSDTALEVLPYVGTALHTETVYDLADIKDDYDIIIIQNCHKEDVFKEFINKTNLHCKRKIATRYSWNDKTVSIPASRVYYSGNGVWREIPADF